MNEGWRIEFLHSGKRWVTDLNNCPIPQIGASFIPVERVVAGEQYEPAPTMCKVKDILYDAVVGMVTVFLVEEKPRVKRKKN